MKKIIVFSVALLISAATYAYSVPLRQHDIKQIYPERTGERSLVIQEFNSLPWLSLFPNSTFQGASSFSPRHQVVGLEYGPGLPGIFKPNNGGGADPIPEPATIMLFGAGLVGLACMGRRRMMKKT